MEPLLQVEVALLAVGFVVFLIGLYCAKQERKKRALSRRKEKSE